MAILDIYYHSLYHIGQAILAWDEGLDIAAQRRQQKYLTVFILCVLSWMIKCESERQRMADTEVAGWT
jgi:hypothetical protein